MSNDRPAGIKAPDAANPDVVTPGGGVTVKDSLAHLRTMVADHRGHRHPAHEDLYCLNLTSYMGERMGGVLTMIDQALALHADMGSGECVVCSDENGPKPWPCATARALGIEVTP